MAAGRDLEGAATEYTAYLKAQPEDANAQAGLASVLFLQRKYPEALDHMRRAVRLNPNNADLEANLGAVLAMTGDLPSAIQAFEQALRIDPSHQAARANLQRARAQLASEPRP